MKLSLAIIALLALSSLSLSLAFVDRKMNTRTQFVNQPRILQVVSSQSGRSTRFMKDERPNRFSTRVRSRSYVSSPVVRTRIITVSRLPAPRVRVQQCTARINALGLKIQRINSKPTVSIAYRQRRTGYYQNRIEVQRLVRHKNILRTRIVRCARTGRKIIIVQNKPCSCSTQTINRWRQQIRNDGKRITVYRRQVYGYDRQRLQVWNRRWTICQKTGKRIILVNKKPCPCKKVNRQFRTWNSVVTTDRTNTHIRVLNRRITRCKKTGRIMITVRHVKKPCGCSTKTVTNWRLKVAIDRQKLIAAQNAERLAKIREHRLRLKYRVTKCKKTGKLIIRNKPCPCTQEKIESWNHQIEEDTTKIDKVMSTYESSNLLVLQQQQAQLIQHRQKCLKFGGKARVYLLGVRRYRLCRRVIKRLVIIRRDITVITTEMTLIQRQKEIEEQLRRQKEEELRLIRLQEEETDRRRKREEEEELERVRQQERLILIEQERIRIEQAENLKKEIELEKNEIKEITPIVQTCQKTGKQYIVYKQQECDCQKYQEEKFKHENIVKVLGGQKITIVKQIDQSRQDHVNTFKDIPSIDTKREIVVHRYNIQIEEAQKRWKPRSKLLLKNSKNSKASSKCSRLRSPPSERFHLSTATAQRSAVPDSTSC